MKKHKNLVLFILIIILALFALYYTKNILNTTETKAVYGERKDAIKGKEISKEKLAKVESSISNAKEVSARTQGRIIEVIITANDNVSVSDAKKMADQVSNVFTNDEKKLYDIQVFIKKDKTDASFPIIGYKHHDKSYFSWTKDR
jgi:predicted nucleic acid binding AN1-type Zn finger protein